MRTYMSLGPTCVPAEILKSGNLRNCTYGFDWFRSDFVFWILLMENDLDTFLERYVYNICIPMRQIENPEKKGNKTGEVGKIIPFYGFNYLYNPHRNYESEKTKEYFYRCFMRTRDALENKLIIKEFVLADYTNKDSAIFLDDIECSASKIKNQLKNLGVCKFRITVIRIKLVSRYEKLISFTKEVKQDYVHYTIIADETLDNELDRDRFYKMISDTCLLRSDTNLYKHQSK